jgi:peptidoglycan/LPS O-acetylase OafA/YrhL
VAVTSDATTTEVEAARGRRPSLPRLRSLDGLRGLAVLAVLLYHLDVPWMTGGFLGVSLFFTLSGFLITSLLIVERDANDRIDIRAFWGRRFRRLLPAAWAGIVVAIAFAGFRGDQDQLRGLQGDVFGALADVANWRFILAGDSYTAGYQAPSPVLHYWSLAIEEQFYVLFPLAVAALVARRVSRRGWAIAFGALLVGSMVLTAVLYDEASTTRVYFGTGTRIGEILVGVLLALAMPHWWEWRLRTSEGPPSAATGALAIVPYVALVAAGVLWTRVTINDQWIYRGGLFLVAVVSCGLVLAAMHPGPLAKVLAVRPLVGLGLISYGVYVYHWPIFLWLNHDLTGLDGVALGAVRVAVTLAVALVSYVALERPIRERRVPLNVFTAGAVAVLCVVIAGAAVTVTNRADARAVETATVDAGSSPIVTQPPITSPVQATGTAPDRAAVPSPKKVLLIGDSLLHQAYPVIDATFVNAGIETRAIGGPGQSLLAHQAKWLGDLQTAVDEYDPDVVIIESCCGHGDKDDLFVDHGTALPLDSDALWDAWKATMDRAIDIAQTKGRLVMWVLAPPAKTNGYYGPVETRIPHANQLAIDAAPRHPGMDFVDWRVIAAPDGSYTDALPDGTGKLVTVRHADGLHFTPAGMRVLADLTLSSVEKSWQAAGGRTS